MIVRLSEALPDFCAELESGLEQEGEPDLSAQVSSLEITSRCSCHEEGCGTFRVIPQPSLNRIDDKIIGARYAGSRELDGVRGFVVVDVDNYGRITTVEVLDRPDVADALERLGISRAG